MFVHDNRRKGIKGRYDCRYNYKLKEFCLWLLSSQESRGQDYLLTMEGGRVDGHALVKTQQTCI